MHKQYVILSRKDGFSKRMEWFQDFGPYVYIMKYNDFSNFPIDFKIENPPTIISKKECFKFKEFVDAFTALYVEVV